MYHDVSTGFELETQQLCFLVRKKGKILTLPTEYTKHAFFQNSLEVYNDALTPWTVFVKDTLTPFLASLPSDSLTVENGWTLEGPWEFNNNEFVATFSRKQSVQKDQLWALVLHRFLQALEKVEAVLHHYEPVAVESKGFPYGGVLVPRTRDPRYAGVAFLAQASPDTFKVEDLSFYYQCTIGFLLDDAMGVFSDLAARYVAAREEPDTVVAPLVVLARTVSPELQNYLFLFLYSAATRHSRKVGTLFILRQAFQDIRSILTVANLTTLDAWMRVHHAASAEEYEYFRRIHFDETPLTQQQKFKKQALWDVGRIPFRKSERRVFVEFRGFQTLLNHTVGKGPKSIGRVRAALSPSTDI